MCEKQLNYLTTPQGMLTCFLMTYWRTYKKELKTKHDEKKDTVAQSQILAFAPFLTQKIFHGQCKNPYLKSAGQLSLCFVFLNFSRSRCIISHFLCFAKVQTKGEKCSFTPPKCQFYDGIFYQVVLWFSRGLIGHLTSLTFL